MPPPRLALRCLLLLVCVGALPTPFDFFAAIAKVIAPQPEPSQTSSDPPLQATALPVLASTLLPPPPPPLLPLPGNATVDIGSGTELGSGSGEGGSGSGEDGSGSGESGSGSLLNITLNSTDDYGWFMNASRPDANATTADPTAAADAARLTPDAATAADAAAAAAIANTTAIANAIADAAGGAGADAAPLANATDADAPSNATAPEADADAAAANATADADAADADAANATLANATLLPPNATLPADAANATLANATLLPPNATLPADGANATLANATQLPPNATLPADAAGENASISNPVAFASTITITSVLSVASDLAETLTASTLASNVIATCERMAGNNSVATATIDKKERIASTVPDGVTQTDMMNALGMLMCGSELPPACSVSRAPPTLGDVQTLQSAVTFLIERQMVSTDTRSLAPPTVDSSALAAQLTSTSGVNVVAADVPTDSHGSSVEVDVSTSMNEDVAQTTRGTSEKAALLDLPTELASAMNVDLSSFAFVSSPHVAGDPYPPPPPAYGAPGTAVTYMLKKYGGSAADFAKYAVKMRSSEMHRQEFHTVRTAHGKKHLRRMARGAVVLQEPAEGLRKNDSDGAEPSDYYIEELDMPEPEVQATTAEQDEMHNTYANENASFIARLRFLYPSHPVPMTPIAHIHRKATNMLVCPNVSSSSQRSKTTTAQTVALSALARAAQAKAPSCYEEFDAPLSTLFKLRHINTTQDPGGVAPGKLLVSHTHKFIFLGLPGEYSAALEDWLSCHYDAAIETEERVSARIGSSYSSYTVVGMQFNAAVRSLSKYGAAINQMKDLVFASQGRAMQPGTDVGLPSLRAERIVAVHSIIAGQNATKSMEGSLDGFVEYMVDAARSHAVGCKGQWWAAEHPMDDVTPADALSMYARDAAIAPSGPHFIFHAGLVSDDTERFEKRFGSADATGGDECLRPLSAAKARVPEPATMALLPQMGSHTLKTQRMVCALHWTELVCGDMVPDSCSPDAKLTKPQHQDAPSSTSYAWFEELLSGLDGEPQASAQQSGLESGKGTLPRRDFEAEEEAMICSRLDEMDLRQENKPVGIITVDTRAFSSPIHSGVKMWQAYAAAHGYVYISLHPGGDLIKAEKEDQDFVASTRVLEVMLSDQYSHIHHFVYTEVDQWMVRPMARLDELFRAVGLNRCHGPVMAGIAHGGKDGKPVHIDTGTFLFRRSPKMRKLLLAWSNTSYGYPNGDTSKPISRQYAFMHNPGVYATFKDFIRVFPQLPFGLPYSTMLEHAHDRDFEGHYDSEMARKVQGHVIQPCVLASLITGQDHTCALHPEMAGGRCSKCTKELSIKLPNGTLHKWRGTQCCSESYASIPVQKYYELATIFEAPDPMRIVDALTDVYEGRAPMVSYHSRLHHFMPSVKSAIPEHWYTAAPARVDLEPALSQRLYYKKPIFMPSCEASGSCDVPEGCFEQMLAVSKLPTTEENQWHDYRHCLTEGSGGSAAPLNAHCTNDVCRRLAQLMRTDKSSVDGGVGIVTIDSRTEHPTITAWRAYAANHGYTYMHLISVATPEDVAQVQDINMLFDWRTNLMLLKMLKNNTFAHVDYFLYTELDQWITTPLTMRLEPLFIAHGLMARSNFMVVVEEYPCRDVRGGGVFNMGTFLFRRGKGMEDLLHAWFNSKSHGGEHNATWPARQGAFSHDPSVYNAFKDRISVMSSACPLGSPYGIALGHVLGGSLVGTFDPERGRDVHQTLILPCVMDSLETSADHTCSLPPSWSGGTCLMCKQEMTVKRNGVPYNISGSQCCGEWDAALPITKFRETAALFEGSDVDGILHALKSIYEGKGTFEAYGLLGVGVLPSDWRVNWNSAVTLKVPDKIVDEAASMADVSERLTGYPSPPLSPPYHAVCDSPNCVVADWEGPRGLVYVAAPKTADTLFLEIFRHIHLFTGMPYAWGGEHAGWREDANARGFACAKDVDPKMDPANGDPRICRCFLEYLFEYNLTADGLWICHDTFGIKHNKMLKKVMPNAKWVTTLRDPFEHALDSFVEFQAPILNVSSRLDDLMAPGECQYDGPGYRDIFSAHCFATQYIDPQLRHCRPDEDSMFTSQLCALGTKASTTGKDVARQYTVLPAEDPVTTLLASLHLDFGVPATTIARIHNVLEDGCHYGSQLSIPAYPSWLNRSHTNYPNLIGDAEARHLARLEANFTKYAAEALLLHQQALGEAASKTKKYFAALNYPANYTPCWAVHFPPVPARDDPTPHLPHSELERWGDFDNANYRFSQTRLDQCMSGLPDNINKASHLDDHPVARHEDHANELLSTWLNAARAESKQCFNTTGYEQDLSGPHIGDALVSDRYKIAFETSAKSASMSATAYMQCRFEAAPNRTAQADYTRLMIMREPKSRAVSAFLEQIMHYIAILRLSPAEVGTCADAFPEGLRDTRDDHNHLWTDQSPWPKRCKEVMTHNPYTKEEIPQYMHSTISVDEPTMRATADSSLLNALWELPAGCRQLGREAGWGRRLNVSLVGNASFNGVTWWCDEPECGLPCEMDSETMLRLFGHALSDAAKQNMIGCGDPTFGGEHMWPQFVHFARAGRADAILRLESIEEDTERFETWLEGHLNVKLPPAEDNCSIVSTRINTGTVLESTLANQTLAAELIHRSPELQRRICVLYYHDYVCGGYELLPACQEPVETWMRATVRDLLDDRPMPALEADHASSRHQQQPQQHQQQQRHGGARHFASHDLQAIAAEIGHARARRAESSR